MIAECKACRDLLILILLRGYNCWNRYWLRLPTYLPMKNVLLVLLMLLLPWQAITAAERVYLHVTSSSGQGEAAFIKHFTEHNEQILHHHDDDEGDGVSHQDDTAKSWRHLADIDHGFSINLLLPAAPMVATLPDVRVAPVIRPEFFEDRTPLPPRRPPRTPA